MPDLGDAEIDFIREDIRRRGVFTESLQENLLDHLCCFIEEQPKDNRPFAEVYAQALEAFGQNGLQQVQDETLFIINHSHLNTMKKLMYISGAIASISLIAGAFFKVNHWPGANVLLLLGTVMLTILFIPSFFYLRFKEQSEKKEKAISAIGMVTALILAFGALFRLLHWPYGTIIVTSGFGLLFFVFLPLYIINGIRNPITRFSSVSSGFLFACLGGFMMLLSFQNPSMAVQQSYESIHQDEKAMLLNLQSEWKKSADSKPIECDAALKDFVSECQSALQILPGFTSEDEISRGYVISPAELVPFQQKIDAAIAKLNTSLGANNKSVNSYWKEIPKTKFLAGPSGNIQFQLLQLECRVYLQANGI